jgi:hypothetical protein
MAAPARTASAALLRLLCVGLVAIAGAEEGPQHPGFGCEKRLKAVCPGWQASKASCLACVHANLPKLEPNCTLARAETKCSTDSGGGGLPVGPAPLPPTPPTAGAPRPHIVLFVSAQTAADAAALPALAASALSWRACARCLTRQRAKPCLPPRKNPSTI